MAVNVKLGVDTSGFKSGISEANAQLKSFDATLKFAESSFKKTGDAEAALATKTTALTGKLETQKRIVQSYEQQLKKMRDAGIDPASKSYQQMQAAMINAQAAAIDTEVALNGLSASQMNAAGTADKLTQSVNGISKKISLDQVISGINSITSGLENAAKKAVDLGEQIWGNIMNSAKWADDTATMAMMYGIDLDTFQRMQKLVTNGLDTSVDAVLNAQSKLKRGIGSDAEAVSEALKEMGISMTTFAGAGKYGPIEQAKDSMELFWEVGQKLMEWGDEYQKEDMAQKLFGRGWKELVPLFSDYKSLEDYKKALEEVNVNSEEDVNALAELNDKVAELKGNFETLSNEVWAAMAPALTEAAKALNGVLDSVLKYLETPEGQEALNKLGDAVSGLFADLGKIDPEKVVQGFVEVFTKVTGGIQWLVDNKETAKGILGAVVGAWGTLTIGSEVLKVMKFIDGIRGLSGGSAAADGAAAGASWGGAFASAVEKAAPWLVGLYTLLKPGDTQDNSLITSNGITQEGYYEFARQGMEDSEYKSFLMELGTYFGKDGMARLMGDAGAVGEIWNYLIGGKTGYNTLGFVNQVLGKYTGQEFGSDWLGVEFNEEELNAVLQGMDLTLTPKILFPENTAAEISKEIGTVPVAIQPVFHRNRQTGEWMGLSPEDYDSNANGLPFVPYDGYLSLLHRGERVMTARENRNYTYNNNTYFGSVNLNNGLEIDALTESIARNNRRKNSGYGAN